MVKPTQIDINQDYTKLSGRKGTNRGGFFRHKQTGKEYYIKWLPEQLEDRYKDAKKPLVDRYKNRNLNRFHNEFLALKLYELYETAVPKAELISFKEDGKLFYGIATEKETDIVTLSRSLREQKAIKEKIQEDFLIDVLLSNYDVAGLEMDNIYWNSRTRMPLRLDTGAALKYRAQGAPKRNQFNVDVHEFEEMESGNNNLTGFQRGVLEQASSLFKGVHNSHALTIGLRKLLSVSDQAIMDCVNEHGFNPGKLKGSAKNKEIMDLLLARKKRLIERAEEKIFNQLIREFYHNPCSKNDTTYKQFPDNQKEPIYRVKHGGMHASRVALYTEDFISLLQEHQYAPAMNLTAKDRFLIKVAAMFHDAGRLSDQGNDKKEWETYGAEKCRNWLKDAGFESIDIERVCEAIAHKDDEAIQNRNIIALVLGAADSLDWVRSHSSDFNPDFLPPTIKQVIPQFQIVHLAAKAKKLASIQGDSPRAQLDQEGVFLISTKRKYEHDPEGCYHSTRKVFDEIQIPEKVVEERAKQLDKTLNFFKVEAYAKYSDTKFKDSIDQFILEAKKINKELSSRYKEDQQYKDQLEGRLCQLALESFPHQNTIIRLLLDLILWPLCFINKCVTGSWFFSTADSNLVKLFKTELISVDEAVSHRNWKRFSQLLARKEPISKSIRETASKYIKEDDRWDVGFQLEKSLSEGKYALTQGPLMKSIQTKQLEELIHKLLTLTNFKMIHSDKSDVLKFDTGEEFNVTDIFKYANMSHLSLSASDYSQYEQHLIHPSFKIRCQKLQSKFPDLTIAEMAAIRIYTGHNYTDMNSLLRGSYPYSAVTSSTLRSVICHTKQTSLNI